MLILTPDAEENQLVSLMDYDYLHVAPCDDRRHGLYACTNEGLQTLLKKSTDLFELRTLQNCIETSERCPKYAPTTATLH